MVLPMYSTEGDIAAAGALIRAGGIVVFPTETVYGLGANALDENAVQRVFSTKGRPADNPLIVHLADISGIGMVASEIGPTAHRLLLEFAPGPLTVILPARGDLPRIVTAGLDTVAVRVPSHPVAQGLLRSAGVPVAAPSANRSGEPSPTTVGMAMQSLGGKPDAYLDGGPCAVGLESTVLSVLHDQIRILRPGAVTEADILAVLPDVTVHSGRTEPVEGLEGIGPGDGGTETGAESPGLRHRHYQPRADVLLWETPVDLAAVLGQPAGRDDAVMVIAPVAMQLSVDELTHHTAARVVIRTYADVEEYARRLYAWFTECDEAGAVRILAHLPSHAGLGAAIRDRLARASDSVP